jgi:glutathione peroxidase
MRRSDLIIAVAIVAGSVFAYAQVTKQTTPKPTMKAESLHDFVLNDIDGKPVKLSKFKGKTVLIVNVASRCGLTPQYTGLEALYNEFKKQGVVVLGFPANNYMGQEPGTEAEIKTFCSSKYNVTFPMFSKVSTKGDDQSPIYKWLVASSDRPTEDIEWNFGKFVIGKDGKVFKRLKPTDTPDSEAVRTAIEAALKG